MKVLWDISKTKVLWNMPYTLVIIDMQPYFYAAKAPDVQNKIVDQIKVAKKSGHRIVVVEYRHCHSTFKNILDAIGNYKNAKLVEKNFDDGSNQVLSGTPRMYRHWFRLCGVNTDACVLRTANGLANKLPGSKVDIIADACNSEHFDYSYFTKQLKRNVTYCENK